MIDYCSSNCNNPFMSASEGHLVVGLTCKTLKHVRNGKSYDLFGRGRCSLNEVGVNKPE